MSTKSEALPPGELINHNLWQRKGFKSTFKNTLLVPLLSLKLQTVSVCNFTVCNFRQT